jgi:hypothetical protein
MSKKKTQTTHHEELVSGLAEQMKPIFDSSEQAMYIYLDDTHKTCNSKFAKLLGYDSPKEWADVQGALEPFVEKKSQETLASAYWKAMEKFAASSIDVTWKKKHGGLVKTNVILVPMAYSNHILAVHFIETATK